jgi:hypothetical protein
LGLHEGDKALDFGCAKGYLVKALRLLYIDAYGVDISAYAIANAPRDVLSFVKRIPSARDFTPAFAGKQFKAVIAKDVLEHLDEPDIACVLEWFRTHTERLFVIVPLGSDGKYYIPAYDLDKTHKIRQPLAWWKQRIERSGFEVQALHSYGHIKEHWVKEHPQGNGFLIGTKK